MARNKARSSKRSPAQGDGSRERVTQRFAGPPRFKVRRFQFEIPTRLAVGIVHQHHAIFVCKAERLLLNYFCILPDESRPQHVNHERHDGEPRENVPRGDEIQAGTNRGAPALRWCGSRANSGRREFVRSAC